MTLMHDAIPKQCPMHSPAHCGFSNARTYRRTYKQLLTLSSYLTLGNARRGAAKFHPLGGKL